MALITTGQPRRPRKGTRRLPAVKPPKSLEVEYRNAILRVNFYLKQQTNIISRMVSGEEDIENVTAAIQASLRDANQRYDVAASRMSSAMIRGMDERNKNLIQQSLRRAMGVDGATIIDSPEVKNLITTATEENVALIKSIPEQHFAKVTRAVIDNYKGIKFEEGSLANRLKALGGYQRSSRKIHRPRSDSQPEWLAQPDQTARRGY